MPDDISIRQREWSGRIPSFPLYRKVSFFVIFGCFVTHIGSTSGLILTIYTFYDVFPCKDVPFGRSDDIPTHLEAQIPKNRNFGGVNRHFQAKHAKCSKFHIIESTAWIATKFCTAVKITKYASWVDSGRPPSQKIDFDKI